MSIQITFRHMEATDALKQHVNQKLSKLDKYLHKNYEVNVALSIEGHTHKANLDLQTKNFNAQAESQSDDMYSSIDGAVDKLEKTVRRHKDKVTSQKSYT